jgi:hypothetical protein
MFPEPGSLRYRRQLSFTNRTLWRRAERRSSQGLEIRTGFSYRSAANVFHQSHFDWGPEPFLMFHRG